MEHFNEAFSLGCDGALAAAVFHKGIIDIGELKEYLKNKGVCIRD